MVFLSARPRTPHQDQSLASGTLSRFEDYVVIGLLCHVIKILRDDWVIEVVLADTSQSTVGLMGC